MSETTGPQDDKSQSFDFGKMVDPHFNPEEEKLLDQKYDSVWQPQFVGESRCWRLFIRGAIIGLAIGLLWLTSLTLATTIAGLYVAAPTYDDAVNEWSFAVQIASQEQANAGDCVVRELATCHTILNMTYQNLLAKSQEQALQNDLVVQAEASAAAICQTSWDGSILATSAILKKILLNQTIYSNGTVNSTCTGDDVLHLKQLLGDVSEQKSDVYLKNVQYSRDSNSFLNSAADSAKNRTDYDVWYIQYKFGFLGNWSFDLWNASFFHIGDIDAQFQTLNVSINNLVGCIGLNGSCPFNNSARQVYLTMKQNADLAWNATMDTVNSYKGAMNFFNDSLSHYLVQVDLIFSRMNTYMGTIQDILATLHLQGELSILELPDWRELLPSFPSLAALPVLSIPSPEAQFAAVKPLLNQLTPNFQTIRDKVRQAANRWKDAINASFYFPDLDVPFSIPNYFADYDPPPIVVDTSGFSLVTTNFLDSSRVSLDGFNSLPSTNFSYNTSFNVSAIIDKLPSFSKFSLMSAPFSGSFDFYNIFSSLGNIMFLLISADIIYRIFNSVSIVRKYTRLSELGLPVIDIREFEAAKQSTNPTMAMYQLCTSPLILVVILAVVGLVILGALVALYVPMFVAYQNGCVKSSNGTLLTQNAYAFAYNYAATEANEQTGSGLSKYDKERTEDCTAATQQFNDRQSQQQDDIVKIRQTYDSNANDLALYQRCIIPSVLPSDDATWLNLTNYSSPFNNNSLSARLTCDRPGVYVTNGIGDGSFDCTLLPPCNLTCTGPDTEALQAVTYDSGCTTEWTFHSGLFRALLGLLVFVCLNISRVLLMTAVIRLAWRQLTSHGFEFQGTCNKMGEIEGLQEKLKVAVDKAIKAYERGAVAMLVGAVLIHIPYLVVLSRYGNALQTNSGPGSAP